MTPMKKQAQLHRRIDWSQARRSLYAGFLTALGLLVLDFIYFASIWPDWRELEQGSLPKSRYMKDYQVTQQIQWLPLSGQAAKHLTRPFIIAEDSRFYQHNGFDLQAIQDAMRINWQARRWVYGASTISQQTVKNLFLSHERSLLRKWHELVLTLAMEKNLSKNRILSIYLNIAEFGPGIFGVEAASRHYFGTGFFSISSHQAAALAATLPSPRRHNPKTSTRFFQNKKQRIIAILQIPADSPSPHQMIEPIFPPEDQADETTDKPVADHSLPAENQSTLAQETYDGEELAPARQVMTEEYENDEGQLNKGSSEVIDPDAAESNQEFLENFDPSSEFD